MEVTTDYDALVASQIAYMNIEEEDIEEAKEKYGSATLENILKANDQIEQQYIERTYNTSTPEEEDRTELMDIREEEARNFLEQFRYSKIKS